MAAIYSYLELHKGLRTLVLCLGFGIASVGLFLGISIHFFEFKGDERGFVLLLLSLIALALDVLITWILGSSLQRTYGKLFMAVSGTIVLGTVLVSLAIWRTHWLELVKEIIRSSLTRQ